MPQFARTSDGVGKRTSETNTTRPSCKTSRTVPPAATQTSAWKTRRIVVNASSCGWMSQPMHMRRAPPSWKAVEKANRSSGSCCWTGRSRASKRLFTSSLGIGLLALSPRYSESSKRRVSKTAAVIRPPIYGKGIRPSFMPRSERKDAQTSKRLSCTDSKAPQIITGRNAKSDPIKTSLRDTSFFSLIRAIRAIRGPSPPLPRQPSTHVASDCCEVSSPPPTGSMNKEEYRSRRVASLGRRKSKRPAPFDSLRPG